VFVRLGREAPCQLGMTESAKSEIPAPLLLAFARLDRRALGVAFGTVAGLGLFTLTAMLLLKGGVEIGPRLSLLGQFLIGYSATFPGMFIGLGWGFVVGFAFGWLFALLHNFLVWIWLTLVRSRAEMDQYGDFLDHM
jgi:hypothetical protein